MKRSAPLRSKKPWRPQRPPRERTLPAVPERPPERRSTYAGGVGAATPKRTPLRSPKLRDSAKGEACTLRLVGVCNLDWTTTVLAHSNRGADGKGLGQKADDDRACYACHACHDVLDRRVPLPVWLDRADVEREFDRAMAETRDRMREKGLI